MTLRRGICCVAALVLLVPMGAQKVYKTQPGTEILWDTWGVPHVYAKSVPDMFYCFGWAQAEAHGDLLLKVMGQSRGRGAEYFGRGLDDVNLKTDRWIWTNEAPSRAAKWLAMQTPEFRGYLEAFAAGIDGYAAKHPEALTAEVKQVLPITALDVIEHEEHFYDFEFVAGKALAVPAKVSRAEMDSTGVRVAQGLEDTALDAADGSNGWAIGPSHSANGHAMMLLNPHLGWGGESTYFEVQLTAPGVNLYGATQIGVPALRFVTSEEHSITNTVNVNNGHLLYRITEKDGGYLFDGKVKPYEKASYPIKVLQPGGGYTTENVEVWKTVHGPVIRTDAGVPIAMYVAGLDKPYMLEQVWKMSTSHNFAEYQTQLKRLQIPMYTIMYADREGHIEYLFNAPVPRRSEGDYAFWSKPVDGSTSRLLPTGALTYEELPKLIDPASGYVQNSNQPPWDAGWPTMIDPAKYPAYVSPEWPYFRSDRSLRMLSEDQKMSFDMLLQKKLSTRSEAADRLLPGLLVAVDQYGSPKAKQAAAVLRAWDRETEEGSVGALLFWNWATKFGMPGPAGPGKGFAVPYALDKPLTTPSGVRDPKAAAAMLEEAATETEATFGAMDEPWGKYLRLEINGQSDGNTRAVRGPALNGVDLPGNGGPGAIGIFRVVTPGPVLDGTSTPIHGDGFTMAVEFSTPMKSESLVSYGECSQPGCAHHTDELPLFEKKEWRVDWRTKAEVEKHLEKVETF
jgi:acyl-homoserine-lactone acylase